MVSKSKATHRKVKALLIEKNIKQIDIARKLNLSPSTVSLVINGHQNSQRVKETVAKMLGIPVETLWPSDNRH